MRSPADAACIEKGDALVGPLAKEFAADHLGVELDAAVDVADRDAEMRDAFDLRHDEVLLRFAARRLGHFPPARNSRFVMAGVVPAIHVLLRARKGVDARHKAGHE